MRSLTYRYQRSNQLTLKFENEGSVINDIKIASEGNSQVHQIELTKLNSNI